MTRRHTAIALIGLGLALAVTGCFYKRPPWISEACVEGNGGSGFIKDEAFCAGRTADSFAGADEDYFKDMDYGISQRPDDIAETLEAFWGEPLDAPKKKEMIVKAVVRGRNNWLVWTGGNDKFWDHLNINSIGNFDLLKLLSNHPALMKNPGYSRDNRWYWFGLVNEPCFRKNVDAGGKPVGRKDRFGLYLDARAPDCPKDPFENEEKYPGVEIGARGKPLPPKVQEKFGSPSLPVGSYYGYASGVVGLRLFPNPDFDEAAAKRWDPEKYYTDEDYYNDKHLVKPYRVGMACGFCHVGPNPTNPPKDPENPTWANLNSNPGAQYFWFDRVFSYQADPQSFLYQLLSTNRPGALDTSLVSTDYMNNPRTMNAVYNLAARMKIALLWGKEKLSGGELDNKHFDQFEGVPATSPLRNFHRPPHTVWTPMVLKDGADSAGALGALNRVFVNIGLFSEEWLQDLRNKPLVGGEKFLPFRIRTAERNSSYWKATELQTLDTALFFLAATPPDPLEKAPDGGRYLTRDKEVLKRGKLVFAENCARCHSSKLPEEVFTRFFPDQGCNGPNYLNCWNEYWRWTKTRQFKEKMKKIALKDDFLEDNYLSTELRIPVTLLETNICASLATNALEDDTWDNFSSTSYKSLPSVGSVVVHDPRDGTPRDYPMPAGGRGYIRPPSLVSVWSTAPFLLNNTLGKFYPSGSVEDRMKSFQGSIEQLLWPETRSCDQKELYAEGSRYGEVYHKTYESAYEGEAVESCKDRSYVTRSGRKVPGIIDRTWTRSYLKVPRGYLPALLQPLAADGWFELGPIPAGTPVNLISNLDLENRGPEAKAALKRLKTHLWDLVEAKGSPDSVTDAELRRRLGDMADPLLALNKCPDFVVNRGHYFGTEYMPAGENEPGLSDGDKQALIEFIKTM